jgi:hypothetical protein
MSVKWDSASVIDRLKETLYDSVRREILYRILTEFVILMQIGRLIKMCLN